MGIGLLAIISIGLIGGVIFVLNQYLVITPREAGIPTTAQQSDRSVLNSTPSPALAQSATPVATPEPTVDLIDLETRMQDWPEEVTLASPATFPGEKVVPAGAIVKLLTAGPDVEVEYQDEQATLSADQTDLVARVLSHRAQVAKDLGIEHEIAELRAAREKSAEEARDRELERVYGKSPTHEDAYFAVKLYLKQKMKQLDSIEIISLSPAAPADYNGKKCWAVKVQFRSRDEIGVADVETGTAYLNGDEALGYEKSE